MPWKWENDPANPNATPIHPNPFYLGIGAWSYDDWRNWHITLERTYGLQIANQIIVTKWHDKAWYETTRNVAMITDPDFKQYAQEKGFLEGIYSGMAPVYGDIMQWHSDVGTQIEAVVDDAKNAFPWLKWVAIAIAALLALQILTNAGILGKKTKA